MTILDNASCESLMGITLMGDYTLDYLPSFEKKNPDTVVGLSYGFVVDTPGLPTRVCNPQKPILITYVHTSI